MLVLNRLDVLRRRDRIRDVQYGVTEDAGRTDVCVVVGYFAVASFTQTLGRPKRG